MYPGSVQYRLTDYHSAYAPGDSHGRKRVHTAMRQVVPSRMDVAWEILTVNCGLQCVAQMGSDRGQLVTLMF